MKLDDHLKIIFKNIFINNKISFLDLWEQVNFETKHNFNLNSSIAFKRIVKSFFLLKYYENIKDKPESILEVGVFRGFSGLFLEKLEMIHNKDKNLSKIFLIDSFEGLSKLHTNDLVANQQSPKHTEGHFKVKYDDISDIFNNKNNVQLVKGWIPDVFKNLDNKNLYKFVHLDVDLYEPTISTLEYIFDKVVKGGVIITDDFNSLSFPGNRIAWQEFFKNKKILNSIALPSGQAVYIKDC